MKIRFQNVHATNARSSQVLFVHLSSSNLAFKGTCLGAIRTELAAAHSTYLLKLLCHTEVLLDKTSLLL